MARLRKQQDIPAPDLNLNSFIAWLKEKPTFEAVGSLLPIDCPIANWMDSIDLGSYIRCTRWRLFWTPNNTTIETSMPLPEWALAFTTHLMTYHYGKTVTAGEVLAILGP